MLRVAVVFACMYGLECAVLTLPAADLSDTIFVCFTFDGVRRRSYVARKTLLLCAVFWFCIAAYCLLLNASLRNDDFHLVRKFSSKRFQVVFSCVWTSFLVSNAAYEHLKALNSKRTLTRVCPH